MRNHQLLILALFCNGSLLMSFAFVPHVHRGMQQSTQTPFRPKNEVSRLEPSKFDTLSIRGGGLNDEMRNLIQTKLTLSPAAASLVAGSVAGAIGVGIAFPLDTLKTKSQVLASNNGGSSIKADSVSGTAAMTNDMEDVTKMNMFQLIGLIYRMEGLSGFFGGVKGMMIGQAIIKSVAFSANAWGLTFFQDHMAFLSSTAVLLCAACFSGFVTSFLVTPIERVKIMMQASNDYKNEIDCLTQIIKNDDMGVLGVFNRGLGPTLAREIPSYGIYFLVYGIMMQLPIATAMGKLAPLVFGAMSGMLSWIPVYPLDVVKTLVQCSDGSEETVSSFIVAKELFEQRGIGGFFDGLTPKMLRAAVNHSVTFFIYDLVMDLLKN